MAHPKDWRHQQIIWSHAHCRISQRTDLTSRLTAEKRLSRSV
jgi:hypothetical protein